MLRNSYRAIQQWLGLAAMMVLVAPLGASAKHNEENNFCNITAHLLYNACKREIEDDKFGERAVCVNISDGEEREECFDDVKSDHKEAKQECRDQRTARRDLCEDLGEARYDPSFEPEDFQTFFDNLNPYYPIAVGNLWVYESEDETVSVEVLDATKLIEGVTCIVVNDVVEEDDDLIEDTDDWFGQRMDGTIDYCGEEAKDFEYTDGDMPRFPELVEIEGSFKAGRDGAKSGTLFMGSPVVGAKYRQEWAPTSAEDIAEVLSIDYGFGNDERFDEFVPEELVELLCDDDCVVTADTSPLDPEEVEYKFYAYGIGLFLEVKPDEDESLQLVECNVDPKCDLLPEP